jgi:hypothetical protein
LLVCYIICYSVNKKTLLLACYHLAIDSRSISNKNLPCSEMCGKIVKSVTDIVKCEKSEWQHCFELTYNDKFEDGIFLLKECSVLIEYIPSRQVLYLVLNAQVYF